MSAHDPFAVSAVQSALRSGELGPATPSPEAGTPVATGGGFAELVNRGLGEVNRQLLASQADLQRLATGDVQNLHQIMIRLEESRMSFQLLLHVRNRLLEAYQDVLKMQV